VKRLSAVFALVVIFLWLPLALTLRKGFSVQGMERLFANHDLLSSLNQSLLLAAVSALVATIMGTLTAFALPRLSPAWRRRFETTLLLPLLLPEIALGLALLVWFVKIGVNFGWGTLVAGHVGFCFTYSTLVMKANIESLDKSLIDAARDLGASTRSVLRHALLPQLIPGLVASLATSFALSLDDFLISFFIKGMDQVTLPIKIFSMLRLSVGVEIYTLSLFLCGISILGVLVSQLCFKRNRSQLSH
jgi:spermidine/putrescine transport system permease protein